MKLRIVGVVVRTVGTAVVVGVFSSCIEVTDLMADSWKENICNNNIPCNILLCPYLGGAHSIHYM